MPPHLVAIVGGSGSGKSWIAQHLHEAFGNDAGRLSLEDFRLDLSHLPPKEREKRNFDHPEAIDWPLFRQSVSRIRCGDLEESPDYDFATRTRRPAGKPWRPCRLVLIDGLWLLHDVTLRDLYTLSVFVESTEEFQRQAAPMHNQFVAPQLQHADLVVHSRRGNAMISELVAVMSRLLRKESPTP